MPKELERDLGLYAVITISIGAMIGSGIFVLPGLATKIAGPAAILAYLLAGLIVLPAALSKAEMATAMPESGGTYLYIDRALGPLPGTVAGIGAWFSLVFKSAFALVGLGAYLLLFVDLPTIPVALGLAVVLVAVNVLGAGLTGRLQAVIVTVVLAALVAFVANGLTFVNETNYHPFFPTGSAGVVSAAGFVFVSYAGVTKIASVAEEIEDPGRNIPIGMLSSVVLMMFVYTFVVFVIVGLVPAPELSKTLTPMALAAGASVGEAGLVGMAAIAVLALASMANAGVLSSSRYPLAMARDSLAPPSLVRVSDSYGTPVRSILLTGAILVGLIAFVPVRELAKLASAFKILVFVFINVALVAFRESSLQWYDPTFTAPGYPWVQLFGIVGGLVLIPGMGLLPLLGAVGILLVSVTWYRVYGRAKTEREGAALDALRRAAGDRAVADTRAEMASADRGDVVVAIDEDATPAVERTLLRFGAAAAGRGGGTVHVVRFEGVPDQVSLSSAAAEVTAADREFESRTARLADSLDVPVDAREVVSHDTPRAVVNYATDAEADLLLGAWEAGRIQAEMLDEDVDWFMHNAPCDTGFVRGDDLEDVDEIAVLTRHGPYAAKKVALADAVGAEHDASLRFVTSVGADPSDELLEAVGSFHDDLAAACRCETSRDIVRSDDPVRGLANAAVGADTVVLGVETHSLVGDIAGRDFAGKLLDHLDQPVLLFHNREREGGSFLRTYIARFLF